MITQRREDAEKNGEKKPPLPSLGLADVLQSNADSLAIINASNACSKALIECAKCFPDPDPGDTIRPPLWGLHWSVKTWRIAYDEENCN